MNEYQKAMHRGFYGGEATTETWAGRLSKPFKNASPKVQDFLTSNRLDEIIEVLSKPYTLADISALRSKLLSKPFYEYHLLDMMLWETVWPNREYEG